ncbi:MAG: hypothetical protein H6R17_477 [Proteobacteria bacterium]|nr:hypothetical protein [Pseudomonadota bacterium]
MEILTLAGKVFALIGSVVGAIIGAYKWAYRKGLKEGRRDLTYSRDCQSLEHLYAPLLSLLLDIHISSCTLTKYGTFQQRFDHAVAIFKERRYVKSKMKGGFAALFDHGVSEPSVGIDYGPGFPISEIGEVIKKQAHLAPPELIVLYQRTSREEYERGGMADDELTAYHLELAEHIFNQHELLTNRVRFAK